MEPTSERKNRARRIVTILKNEYPDSVCPLTFRNPLELLIKTILSAQCTDERVNQVGTALFRKYAGAEELVNAPAAELENAIRPAGLFRVKARHVQNTCGILIRRFRGKVPKRMDELLSLPGVGRKTANVILGNAYYIPAMVVDTHVIRIANLLKLTRHKDPEKIEADLMEVIPGMHWVQFSHWISDHGRRTCIARRPQCRRCALEPECPSSLMNYN